MFIWAPCAQLYSLPETRHPPPFPSPLRSYMRVLLVSQDISLCDPLPWTNERSV
jgi:hypothetical protein